MIKYPTGKQFLKTKTSKNIKKRNNDVHNFANRGMGLESDINESNSFYYENDICLITKRPTPINVVKVDYTNGPRIVDAYFEKQSTTDYNGVYKGRYIDFEAKSTTSKTSFPIANITSHQINHLRKVIRQKGIAFFIIEFSLFDETYLLDASYVIDFYEHNERKSIPYNTIKNEGVLIEKSYSPRLKYIDAINKKYFENV